MLLVHPREAMCYEPPIPLMAKRRGAGILSPLHYLTPSLPHAGIHTQGGADGVEPCGDYRQTSAKLWLRIKQAMCVVHGFHNGPLAEWQLVWHAYRRSFHVAYMVSMTSALERVESQW